MSSILVKCSHHRVVATTRRTRVVCQRQNFPLFDIKKRFSRFFGSSATKITDDNEDEYLTNGGIVEGVWIFFRHGDRAPSRPLCPSHKVDEEGEFWLTRLPRPSSLTAFEAFSKKFPPSFHPTNNQGEFLDVRRAPFGFLTHTGITQTRENGSRLFKRYNRHGYHFPDHERYLCAKDFLDVWDLKVYSTNYLRTILSVQSFLDGLLGTNCYGSLQQETNDYDAISNNNSKRKDETDSLGDMKIPNHSSIPENHDGLVTVQVRGRDEDTLNAFDRNPDLMADLVSEVISSPEFQERDGHASPLAARLANILPGLARKKKNTSGFNAAPSGINWVEASDHFVCRNAHKVPFSRFSDFEHDDRVEMTLSALSHQTMAHLAWRFRQWYKNPKLLDAIAAPPLREMADQLKAATVLQDREKHPFTVYSCHDVTILALLYGIGAEFLSGDDDLGGWRYWPSYATTLVFELVRIDDSSENSDMDGRSHVVRVLLNGKPVLSVNQVSREFWEGGGQSMMVGNGPYQMLYAADFEAVVTKLEQAGGFQRQNLQSDDSSIERDMSNWTG